MGNRRASRLCSAIAAGLIASAFLAVPSAQAASAKSDGQASGAVTVNTSAQAGTSASTQVCAQETNFYGHIGHRICGTTATLAVFPGTGYERMFIIGLDHAVWNIVKYPDGTVSGWRSLYGWLQIDVDTFDLRGPYDLGIMAIGGDGGWWCNRLSGSWRGWAPCGSAV